MSNKILVTGGFGYIGSVLVRRLLKEGYSVTVVDNLMYNQTSLVSEINHHNLSISLGDIRDRNLMKNLIASNDILIPLAAIVGAPACNKNPELATSVNKDATLWMIENSSKDQLILMPTTNSAYGVGEKDNFCDENSPLFPLSQYAKEKVLVEQELLSRGNVTSFRLATVFGLSERMRLDLLVNNFVYRALTDGFIVIFEGGFKRNYIHITDVAEAFLMAIRNESIFKDQIFNVGLSSANISKYELCMRIKTFIPSFVVLEDSFKNDPDQRNYVVSNDKIEKLGFQPKVTLNEGIQELIKGLPMFVRNPFSNI